MSSSLRFSFLLDAICRMLITISSKYSHPSPIYNEHVKRSSLDKAKSICMRLIAVTWCCSR